MKTPKDYFDAGMQRMKTFNVNALMPALRYANDGAINDVLNTNGCANYQWIASLMDVWHPKQIVELGGAMGVWDLCVLHSLPQDCHLYSITLPEHGLEFSYVKDSYPNFHPVLGDDLVLSNWPKDLDLSKTDVWYFDALHTEEHLRNEVNLYKQFFKKGALLIFDDIRSFGLWPVWDSLPYDKLEVSDPLHFTGYGLAVV